VAIGVSLGTAFWAIMAVTGMTAVVSRYSSSTLVMQLLGGSYLIWLGIKSLRSAAKKNALIEMKEVARETRLHSLWKGLFIQLTNPKPALFWLSMVSVVISRDAPIIVGVVLVLGVTAIAFVWHLALALAFSLGQIRSYFVKAGPYIS